MYPELTCALVDLCVAMSNFDYVVGFDSNRRIHDCFLNFIKHEFCCVSSHSKRHNHISKLLVI
jgi:hypothetical protein